MTATKRIDTIAPVGRDEATRLATVEYERFGSQISTLDAKDWAARTDCPLWDVREMVAHVLGACQSCAAAEERAHQAEAGAALAAETGMTPLDAMNAVQVADRAHLSPAELVTAYHGVYPAAVEGRAAVPDEMRGYVLPSSPEGYAPLTLGRLMEITYTRDTWMHRVDITRATGRTMELTAEHDGRLIEEIVSEWAGVHAEPFVLVLTGPAGGSFSAGSGGEELEFDAVEFARILSGRAPGDGLLKHAILF